MHIYSRYTAGKFDIIISSASSTSTIHYITSTMIGLKGLALAAFIGVGAVVTKKTHSEDALMMDCGVILLPSPSLSPLMSWPVFFAPWETPSLLLLSG
jgi:hypothetical protein